MYPDARKNQIIDSIRSTPRARAISFRTHRHLEDGFLLRFPREHVELLNLLRREHTRMIHSQSSARRALVHTNHKKKGVSPAGETPRFFRFRGPRYTLDTIDADPDRIPRVPSSSPTRRPRRPRRGRTRKRTRYVRLHPPRADVRVARSPRPRSSSNQRPSDALEGETVWSHTERWLITKRSPRAFKRRHERATKPRFQIVRNSPVRFHPSPSRTNRRVAAHSFEIPSRNPSKRKSLRLSHRANTHLRLAKQPAGGATENRARGVRVELGRRPDRRGGVRRRLFLGADDEGGAAGGGRPAGRRPRGHAHLGRGRREAQHVSMDASRCADPIARGVFFVFFLHSFGFRNADGSGVRLSDDTIHIGGRIINHV